MATGDKYIPCEGTAGKQLTISSGALEILNALLVKSNTGKWGFRTVRTSHTAANISPAIACGADLMDIETILRNVVVDSADGKPAIGLIEEA